MSDTFEISCLRRAEQHLKRVELTREGRNLGLTPAMIATQLSRGTLRLDLVDSGNIIRDNGSWVIVARFDGFENIAEIDRSDFQIV